MEIRIHIPRPILTLTLITVVVLWLTGVLHFGGATADPGADAQGGKTDAMTITEARKTIDRESVKREVLERREEILRYQFEELQAEIDAETSEEKRQELSAIRTELIAIIRDKKRAEEVITDSLIELWEAEGTRYTLEKQSVGELFEWPVKPELGISAHFQDDGYKARFGFDHNAIDIPVEQGSVIIAAAAGTVERVALNGLGYSYVVLAHEGDIKTIYGHISAARVQEGDTVLRGQTIALSGGMPGTEGAGRLTTGPHLHFAIRVNDVLTDPMQFLPKIRGL